MSTRLLVRVGGLHTIDADLPSFRPTHLIGILDPTMPEPAAYQRHPPDRDRLVLRFNDSEAGIANGPTAQHVEAVLTFLDQSVFSAAAPGERLFIHCHAGASRSTATAYLALVRQHGVGGAEAAFAELLRITVKPWPNRSLVEFADTHLGARGRLLAPLDEYRAAAVARLSAPASAPGRARSHLWREARNAQLDCAAAQMTAVKEHAVPPVTAGPRTLIRVGGLHTLRTDLSGFRPTHMIGILDPDIPEYPATLVDASDRERLLLRFHDRAHSEPGGPSSELVSTLLGFIDRALACERPVRLFVHCHAGISRSTATAYLALIRQEGVDGAAAAFRSLLTIVNKPWPNRSIVVLADDLLEARGRLLAPLDAYRQEYPRRIEAYGRLHRLRLRRDPGYADRVDKPNWW